MTPVWPEVRLGEVAKIERRSVTPDDIESGTTYVGLEHITSSGDIRGHGPVETGELLSNKFCFTHEHVLYGKLRPNLSKIAAPTFNGVCSTDILPIRPGPRLEKRFLLHFLRQPAQVAKAASLATGANLPRLSPKVLTELTLPLPQLEKQRRIAAILDQADELRTRRANWLALLDELKATIFLDMFGDRRCNRLDAPLVPLADLVDPASPITRGIDQPGPDVEGGVPYIKTTDFSGPVRRSRLARAAPSIAARFPRSVVRAGDSVICIRATVGPAIMIDESLSGVNLSRGTARVSPAADVEPRYLLGCLQSPDFQNQIRERLRGATFLQIPLAELKQLQVLRPDRASQREYARRVGAAEGTAVAGMSHHCKLDSLVSSLRHRAFTGQL